MPIYFTCHKELIEKISKIQGDAKENNGLYIDFIRKAKKDKIVCIVEEIEDKTFKELLKGLKKSELPCNASKISYYIGIGTLIRKGKKIYYNYSEDDGDDYSELKNAFRTNTSTNIIFHKNIAIAYLQTKINYNRVIGTALKNALPNTIIHITYLTTNSLLIYYHENKREEFESSLEKIVKWRKEGGKKDNFPF